MMTLMNAEGNRLACDETGRMRVSVQRREALLDAFERGGGVFHAAPRVGSGPSVYGDSGTHSREQ